MLFAVAFTAGVGCESVFCANQVLSLFVVSFPDVAWSGGSQDCSAVDCHAHESSTMCLNLIAAAAF